MRLAQYNLYWPPEIWLSTSGYKRMFTNFLSLMDLQKDSSGKLYVFSSDAFVSPSGESFDKIGELNYIFWLF